MDIEWINEKYKEANRIFDSTWEVYEWADSLYPDFAGGLRVNVGYATPDDKVFAHLAEHLPKWASNNNIRINVNTSKDLVDGKMIYRIWITPFNE
ncbi:hypothetical protein QFZ77_006929 [Paenibacillus sp. V4I3]|uniref:hypothetical protein n=1 Tax=Paenibacillus sp. V4I3 TaxID=3042305 RepID=UPI002780C80D|nr:hypothetical protein [Paenibacillus sp. V4I3]MDQ0878270.1 hypothetical protein [Paenibacillus sp. V4I3]